MPGQRPQPPSRRSSKTPAERSEEFSATQRRLKEEAAQRREAAAKAEADKPASRDED